jgi:hypothetical protein
MFKLMHFILGVMEASLACLLAFLMLDFGWWDLFYAPVFLFACYWTYKIFRYALED